MEKFMQEKKTSLETMTHIFRDPLDYSKENTNYSKVMESALDGLFSCVNTKDAVESFETQVVTPLKILNAMDSGILDKFLPTENSKADE